MERHIFNILLILTLFGCGQNSTNTDTNVNIKQDIKQTIFDNGMRNLSTGPDFVLFTAINGNTHKSKEMCCESTTLYEAFVNEHDRAYADELLKSKHNNREFSFIKNTSLEIIKFDNYNINFVDSIDKVIPDSIFGRIKQNTLIKKYDLLWQYTKMYPDYFPHLLLRHDIPCRRDCESGYTLTYENKSSP